jgi:N-acetylglutamate synthase-like GNAT family acetyltransferase
LKRESTETSTPTPTVSRSPEKGISGLFTCTSKRNCIEEAPNENTAGPISIDGVKPESPGSTAVISDYSKHNLINIGMSLSSPATITPDPSPDNSISTKSREQKTRDTTLHPLLFKEGGLPNNTFLTYKLKNGEALKQGYKRGAGIVCNCCNVEFTPSHFEDHAGMGRRRQPYHNIYTSEGLTLHKLALQLQDRLNSNGFSKANMSGFDDYPNLSPPDRGKESSTPQGTIIPLKRTLQERVVEKESCYFCGDGSTTIGKIDAEMIVFCNQCERPCHVKCYNNRLEKKKTPLKVLEEYMQFRFLCCEKCQVLRARLDDGLEKCEEIAFLRQIGSNICWRILSGMNVSTDMRQYMPQVIDIFKDAFSETTAEHIDVLTEMVNAKDADGEKDFRGVYCAALIISTHVVSTALLKVRTEEIAELVLVATHCECRKKGYFLLLLKSIEIYLRACNVNLLTVPIDPEMAPIWSEKLGFTILSAEEKKSMLEAHPLVMFENLIMVQKSLA